MSERFHFFRRRVRSPNLRPLHRVHMLMCILGIAFGASGISCFMDFPTTRNFTLSYCRILSWTTGWMRLMLRVVLCTASTITCGWSGSRVAMEWEA